MHNIFLPISFHAASDLVVVDHNSEIADVVNPRGAIFGLSAYVYAEDEKGYRRRTYVATGFEHEVMPKAEALAMALRNRLKGGKLPVCFDQWEESRPCYGSDAYIESDQGYLDRMIEEMEDETSY